MTLPIEVLEPAQVPAVGPIGLFALAAAGDGPPRLLGEESAAELRAPGELDRAECAREGFEAKPGQVLKLTGPSGRPVLVVGLGAEAGLEPDRYRRAAAAFVSAAGRGVDATLLVPAGAPGAAVAEGAVLAAYRFQPYRSSPPPAGLERLVLVSGSRSGTEALREGARVGTIRAAATSFARDLVNMPPSDLNPSEFAERVVAHLSGRPGTSVEVWDGERIAAEHLGGLLGVARGSNQPPRVVLARYVPPATTRAPHVALVGKGITFDSGGLSLKTAEGMTTMKTDMTGAAVVMAALSAASELSLGVRVTAIAMVTENMPGPGALKPGDVLRARNGKTIEVLNTDAEGRLVLADGLSLAAEEGPDAIIDVATLTGAQVVALGRSVGALFGNDDQLMEKLRTAGMEAGEALWPMPMPEQYAEHVDSDLADMKNIGRAGEAGSIIAAMILSRFVDDVPWAHLDIAGPARAQEANGYLSRGGTGFGVRTLVALLQGLGSAG